MTVTTMRNRLFLSAAFLLAFIGCEEVDTMPQVPILEASSEYDEPPQPPPPEPSGEPQEPDSSDVPQKGTYLVEFDTDVGKFQVKVQREWSPRGAERFYQLVDSGFYDGAAFFRSMKGFMVQFGLAADPANNAKWSQPIVDDLVQRSNKRGFVTFATSGPNSRTTQVFINFVDNKNLDTMGFAPFGQVVSGMDVVDKISTAHGEAPDQSMIRRKGNAYLKRNFPKLTYMKTVRIVPESAGEE